MASGTARQSNKATDPDEIQLDCEFDDYADRMRQVQFSIQLDDPAASNATGYALAPSPPLL
jgi:hypothetical protein